jgi:hypothetical protein
MCLEKVVNPAKLDELREGEEVVLTLRDGKTISGRVAEITTTEIKLAETRQLTLKPFFEKVSVGKSEIKNIKRIVRKILAKEWPSLDFEV